MGKYLIILSLFLNISLWSQRPPYKEFNVDNGLPSNTVRCVFKYSKGLIWIGTQSGLVRYDGKNFFVFDESTGLVANEVMSIAEDGFGNLWLGTYGKGVVKYNGKSFTNYNTSNGLARNKIRRVYYSKKCSPPYHKIQTNKRLMAISIPVLNLSNTCRHIYTSHLSHQKYSSWP